ncbi:unnamed protein product [Microthlaspi erraticum]|uniref:DUF4283 domain-containing protein n=1 Tax=Microthlaspi erraticum TaxID=1685480 RepID=A0A6D2IUC5_9BRAS|nr:unnamed protein product [Microthlaspi erraticum]
MDDFLGDSVNCHFLLRESVFPTVVFRLDRVKQGGFLPLGSVLNGFRVSSFPDEYHCPKPPWIAISINGFGISWFFHTIEISIPNHKMSDSIGRRIQDLTLGAEDAPISLSVAVCNQAASANRFCLIGAPVNPSRQNLRALIGQMPRFWGLGGSVVGRILENNQFQFVFTSEEAMNLTVRRGPWYFNEWMIVLQRWTPNFPPETLKIIPFWIQIRGIPLQFLTRTMIGFIGGVLGPVTEIDFDENSTRVDFVRVKKDCPLNGEDGDLGPDFQGENHDDEGHDQDDNNPVDEGNNNALQLEVMSPAPLIPGLGMDGEEAYVPQAIADRDLAVETVRYLQAKMAKGKFTESDFLSVFAAYTRHEESPGSLKCKRRCVDPGMQFPSYDEGYGMALSPIARFESGFDVRTG